MKNNVCLANKVCLPCHGDMPVLTQEVAEKLLTELGSNWLINQSGHLYKQFKFADFMRAMNLANAIAEIAEREAHHPDLTIAWGSCSVEIWTHKINGLTENDFILAAKIESI